MLSDREILRFAEQSSLLTPFDPDMLSGSAYDLRVGKILKSRNRQATFDLTQGDYVIESGECVTVDTLETICLRDSVTLENGDKSFLFALVVNKHTILATGLFHGSTSVDPGYWEKLALTFTNLGPIGYRIQTGARIAKILFFPIMGDVNRLYGVVQKPSVREGSTDMALTIDRPEQAESDERLARMYGKPVERLYSRIKEIEASVELNQYRREEVRRAQRWSIFWAVVAGIGSGIVGSLITFIL